MFGLKNFYISGYIQLERLHTITFNDNLSGVGKFIMEREQEGTGKAYVFEMATDGNFVYYKDIPKPYSGHHFDPKAGIDLNVLFRQGVQPGQ